MSDVLPPFIINVHKFSSTFYVVHVCSFIFVSFCKPMWFVIGRNKRKYLSKNIYLYVVVIADAAPSLPRSHLVDRLAAVVVST